MKVLLLHDKDLAAVDGEAVVRSDAGGLAVHLAHLLPALARAGVSVATIDLRPQAEHEDLAPSTPGSTWRVPGSRLRSGALRAELERIVAHEAPDVVHVHGLSTLAPRTVRALARRAPLVWSAHDVEPVCPRGTLLLPTGEVCTRAAGLACLTGCYRLGARAPLAIDALRVANLPRLLRALRNVARVAAPSAFVREALLVNGFRPAQVRTVPLFSRFDGRDAGDAEEARLLFVGRLEPGKGLATLLDALASVRARDWTLTVVGDGPERARVAAAAEDLGPGRVVFAGALGPTDVARELARSAAVVVPSLVPEAFGLIGVEAMAFGRPVVAFDGGGAGEWLADGETGRLVARGDADALAGALDELLGDPSLAERWGRAGRERYEARYTARAHVERLLALYDDVLAAREVAV